MYAISEMTTPTTRRVSHTFPTFAEAVDFAKSHFVVVHFEQDDDAADFLTKFGTVHANQAA